MENDMGERIRAARTRKGMTQAQAANQSGLGDAAVRLYELGKRTPSDEVLTQVARTLGVTAESLMNLTPSTEREALEMLFRIEERYGCCPQACEGDVALCFNNASNKLKGMVAVWADKRCQLDRGEITEEDYSSWKSSFKGKPWEQLLTTPVPKTREASVIGNEHLTDTPENHEWIMESKAQLDKTIETVIAKLIQEQTDPQDNEPK